MDQHDVEQAKEEKPGESILEQLEHDPNVALVDDVFRADLITVEKWRELREQISERERPPLVDRMASHVGAVLRSLGGG